MRHLGYGIAALTVLAMLLQALIGWVQDHPRADDLRAYVVILGVPAAVILVVGVRGRQHVGWGFLVSAFGSTYAARHGLPAYWFYGGAFLLATVLIQVVPLWRNLPRRDAP